MEAGNLEQFALTKAEDMYNLLTRYSFARRYAGGKSVLDIGWESIGQGTCLLAGGAGAVVGLTGSSEALKTASELYPAPNVSYRRSNLPKLPYEEGSFDTAVAFEVIEKFDEPEELVAEVKRVLREGGVFVVSTPDKQTHSNDRNHRDPSNKQEMYTPEFKEMLERHFEHVEIYRQGSVSGGFVSPADDLSTARVESASLTTRPSPNGEPPESLFVLAVCSDSEEWRERNGQPYLLLDRDRRIFEECADSQEDVELLQREIRRLQQTEVQAFQDSLKLQGSEGLHLKARLERHEAEIESHKARVKHLREQNRQLESLREQNRQLQDRIRNAEKVRARLQAIENSRTWRLFGVYRRLLSRRER
jgi:SAM-dependent methyltransferase